MNQNNTTEVNRKEAVIKALNRMVESGKIAKLSKGKYYKPENTPFGNLQPIQAQVVKDLLEENGKITGSMKPFQLSFILKHYPLPAFTRAITHLLKCFPMVSS